MPSSHFAVAQLKGRLARRRDGARRKGHAHRAPVLIDAAREVGQRIEVAPLFGGGAHQLFHDHRRAHAASTGGVEAVLDGDIVVDQDVLHGDAFLVQHFRGGLEAEHVARVIFDEKKHARAAVHGLGAFNHLVGRGRGEDFAGAGRRQHAGADKATVHRLVAAAATGDHGDFSPSAARRRG